MKLFVVFGIIIGIIWSGYLVYFTHDHEDQDAYLEDLDLIQGEYDGAGTEREGNWHRTR